MQLIRTLLVMALSALPVVMAEPIPRDILQHIRDLNEMESRGLDGLDGELLTVARRAAQLSAAVYLKENYEGGEGGKLTIEGYELDDEEHAAFYALVDNDNFRVIKSINSAKFGIFPIDPDIKGMVVQDKELKRNWLVFRGSKSSLNWLANLEFWQEDCKLDSVPNCKVHHGFHKAWKESADDARKGLKKAAEDDGEDFQVTITGHSLGGATAQVAALYLREEGLDDEPLNADLITFGQPRVGNLDHVNAIHEGGSGGGNNARFVNGRDPVPHSPPRESLLRRERYEHFAPQYWSEKGGWAASDILTVAMMYDPLQGMDSVNPDKEMDIHRDYFYKKISSGGRTEGSDKRSLDVVLSKREEADVEFDEEGYRTILEGWERSQKLPAIPLKEDQVHDEDWYYDPKNGRGGEQVGSNTEGV